MDFSIQYLSFFVIQTDDQSSKSFKHYQTLDREAYELSELKKFLDGEFARIVKRKAERNPFTEQVPTKIGRFIVEPGFELAGNPNYALFQRIRFAENEQDFHYAGDELVRAYMDTSAVRGGALIVAAAKLSKWFDDPILFVMKCDFEPKIASVADEKSLVRHVDMAISAKNIKAIQYPHMPEEGMLEEWELKLHQSSHARYFEDFLKFVSYEPSVPELINEQVMGMVQDYIEQKWQDQPAEHEGKQREEEEIELWAASEQRELQQKWSHEQVAEATMRIVESQPEVELKFKLDGVSVKALLADYGESVHVAQLNGRYILLIEGDTFQFEKGFSPVELLHPESFEDVTRKLIDKPVPPPDGGHGDDGVPW
ncbi:DUF3900 domain-containing protein [Paenibacillus hemerocallicola]|uniref:DUF3900 domain-containing protein n=1 Tax=Paenibacillus hemerocallicola TaxID=1172614 RepID=A0A5C4TG61_9BACL|nr:DUF3900 domain-containing protein [Paenibacillus hemerocallicola]TNJ67935.1 DUF3900 domain-containing protein [Paenibacillus hemerocallicola]